MRITVDQLADRHRIQAYEPGAVRIAGRTYRGSVILAGERIVTDWPAPEVDALDEAALAEALDADPEVIVFGTGSSQRFLPEELAVSLQLRGIGIEVMETGPACRTYNILLGEGRRVVAVLYG